MGRRLKLLHEIFLKFTVAAQHFKGKSLVSPVVVSPDAGGVKRAKVFQDGLSGKLLCNGPRIFHLPKLMCR